MSDDFRLAEIRQNNRTTFRVAGAWDNRMAADVHRRDHTSQCQSRSLRPGMALLAVCLALVVTASCTNKSDRTASQSQGPSGSGATTGGADGASDLTGSVSVDGSSTVFPITEVAAHEFESRFPNVKVTIAYSGTGGGFKRFVQGETDISNASRPIKWEEFQQCRAHGISFIELPVAYDGLTIVVHPSNTWVDKLTVEQLRLIYLEGGAKRWSDVQEGWPDAPLKVFSPGTDSGTYDYFKEVVVGEAGGVIRADLSASEDDNVLVTGVAGEPNSIGYFGAAYYFENQSRLRAVPIVNPTTGQAVAPTAETIKSGEYAPFSRPLLVYVNLKSLRRPEVRKFVEFQLEHAAEFAQRVGYVPVPDGIVQQALQNVRNRRSGTHFWTSEGKARRGPLAEVYQPDHIVP